MLRLYNSFTKKKEVFRSLKNKIVTMYNCGPTVYDFVHIGNLRSFLFADILRRYLEWSGYTVKQVMNITDVGHMTADVDVGTDKMEAAAEREKKSPWQVANFYTKAFFQDINILGIKHARHYPRATDYIKEMIALIERLIKKGHAYVVNGSVYYDLGTFPKYGQLSGNTMEDLVAGARVEVNPEKKHPYDFALWIENPEHLMRWKASWSVKGGYPGWHLECSAMSMKLLGKTIDIHTGGEDNKFPHHECEIAQSEGVTGEQFVRYWLHVKHLLVDGQKMSKSLGNFYTLQDLLKRGFSARAIRYVLLSTHYRDTLNFTFDSLKAAEVALGRVDELVQRMSLRGAASWRRQSNLHLSTGLPCSLRSLAMTAREDFIRAMDDDLNVSKALAVLFGFVRRVNQKVVSSQYSVVSVDLRSVLKLLQEFDKVLGLYIGTTRRESIPQDVKKLVQEREQSRKQKKWDRADAIRKELEQKGFRVEDSPAGTQVERARS